MASVVRVGAGRDRGRFLRHVFPSEHGQHRHSSIGQGGSGQGQDQTPRGDDPVRSVLRERQGAAQEDR